MSEEKSPVYRIGDDLVDAWGRPVEDDGDDQVSYSDMTAKQLMAEIDRRNADRDADSQIVLEGKKKSDAVAALEADDEANGDDEDDTEEQ